MCCVEEEEEGTQGSQPADVGVEDQARDDYSHNSL